LEFIESGDGKYNDFYVVDKDGIRTDIVLEGVDEDEED
jgi:hypothetical protein